MKEYIGKKIINFFNEAVDAGIVDFRLVKSLHFRGNIS